MNALASRTVRPLAATALLVALLAALPARAALFEDDDARRAIIDLRGRFELQNRELNRRLDELVSRIDELAARADRGQLDLQNQIETLRQEIARLRGQLEVQTNELAQTQRRQREVFSDLDTRVKQFEPVTVQIDGITATVEPDEKRSYEAALAQFRAGEFGASLTAFQQFRTRHPNSPYAAIVLFWVGNAQYALKDYKAAITTHQAFLAKSPEHPRVPDALLNIGFAQADSGDKRGARRTLEGLIEKSPAAPAAQMAKERLATLR